MTLKILHLIDSGGLYGAEHMLLELVAEQRRQGLEPLILSAGIPDMEEKPIEAEARRRGLPVLPFRMRAGLNFSKGMEILRFAQREGFDVLHSHGYKFNILLGMIPRWFRRLPLVTTMHGYVGADRWSRLDLYRRLERRLLGGLDGVVFVSRAMMRNPPLSEIRVRKSAVIYNGIDVQSLEQLAGSKQALSLQELFPTLDPGDFVLGAIGRLSEEKGFAQLIRVFARLSLRHAGLRLVIIGEGGLRDSLQNEIDRLGISGLARLAGFVHPVYRVMRELDGIVMPSVSEGLPITLLEVCALRKPIVASRTGGIPEVLEHYAAGLMVEPGDPSALESAIESMLLEPVRTVPGPGPDWTFNSESMATGYTALYRQVLGGGL